MNSLRAMRESRKERFKERRGRLEIIADILLVARGEAKKTAIVYKANLNFKKVERYLPYLEEKGLIRAYEQGIQDDRKG